MTKNTLQGVLSPFEYKTYRKTINELKTKNVDLHNTLAELLEAAKNNETQSDSFRQLVNGIIDGEHQPDYLFQPHEFWGIKIIRGSRMIAALKKANTLIAEHLKEKIDYQPLEAIIVDIETNIDLYDQAPAYYKELAEQNYKILEWEEGIKNYLLYINKQLERPLMKLTWKDYNKMHAVIEKLWEHIQEGYNVDEVIKKIEYLIADKQTEAYLEYVKNFMKDMPTGPIQTARHATEVILALKKGIDPILKLERAALAEKHTNKNLARRFENTRFLFIYKARQFFNYASNNTNYGNYVSEKAFEQRQHTGIWKSTLVKRFLNTYKNQELSVFTPLAFITAEKTFNRIITEMGTLKQIHLAFINALYKFHEEPWNTWLVHKGINFFRNRLENERDKCQCDISLNGADLSIENNPAQFKTHIITNSLRQIGDCYLESDGFNAITKTHAARSTVLDPFERIKSLQQSIKKLQEIYIHHKTALGLVIPEQPLKQEKSSSMSYMNGSPRPSSSHQPTPRSLAHRRSF